MAVASRSVSASWGVRNDAAEEAKAGAHQSEIVSLQQQLAEAQAANKKLGAIIKHQQTTIEHLQVPSLPLSERENIAMFGAHDLAIERLLERSGA